MESFRELFTKHDHMIPMRDGVKLYMSGTLECPWIHLRLSNTEPIARIIAEATTAEEASGLCDEAEELLREG